MTTKKIPIYLIGAAIIALAGCLPYNLPAPTLIHATDTITLTSTRKPTNMPTFTATPVPTLSPNDVYTRVNEFLTNNSYCRLPCWFGIVPQQSTLIDVQTQLTMFSSISTDISYDLPTDNWVVSTLTIPFTDNNLVIEISSAYLAPLNENNISLNEFSTRAYQLKDGAYNGDVYGSSAYNEHLKAYTLSEILSRYGPPSQIFIRSNLSTDELPLPQYSLDSFVIHIWYPNQGIFMEYSMLAGGSGKTYRFCPSNSFISGVLLPTDLGTGYQEVLKRFGGVYPLFFPPAANIKAPEEAFGMTIEEFYQLFRSPTNKCLESPKSIWWPK
jgi:hypothetical protein